MNRSTRDETVSISQRGIAIAVLALTTITAAGLLNADCLPSAPTNYKVPFSLVTLKNFNSGGSQYASWVKGSLTITNVNTFIYSGITLASSGNQQLFSDRTSPVCNDCYEAQPFTVFQPDELGVSISRGDSLFAPANNGKIFLTLTLQSWGNAKEQYTATCDATSGELYYTRSTGSGLITFGTPEPPPVNQ